MLNTLYKLQDLESYAIRATCPVWQGSLKHMRYLSYSVWPVHHRIISTTLEFHMVVMYVLRGNFYGAQLE